MTKQSFKWLTAVIAGIGLAYAAWLDAHDASRPTGNQAVDQTRFYRSDVGADEARVIANGARLELASEPSSTAALRNLALASIVLADRRAITRLKMAERFSRRDATTQLALLEYASSQADFPGTVKHLDRLISVHPASGVAIIDGDMGMITGNPRGRAALANFANRPWFAGYIVRSIERSTDPGDFVDIILDSNMELAEDQAGLLPAVLNRLVNADRVSAAMSVATKLGRVDSRTLNEFGLTAQTVRPDLAPLVWQLGNNSAVQALWAAKSGLRFNLGVNSPATLLERQTAYPPGKYQLDEAVGGLTGATRMNLAWHVDCVKSDVSTVLWRQPVPLGRNMVSYRSVLRIPAGCRIQRWRLNAPAIDEQIGASFRVARLSLQRMN